MELRSSANRISSNQLPVKSASNRRDRAQKHRALLIMHLDAASIFGLVLLIQALELTEALNNPDTTSYKLEHPEQESVWHLNVRHSLLVHLTVQIATTFKGNLQPPSASPIFFAESDILSGLELTELSPFRLEYADENTIGLLIEWAYEWVVIDRGHKDGILRARDLPDFLYRVLNPADRDIEDEERNLLKAAANNLREEQGLHDDDMHVHSGFLSRGSPVRFIRDLARKMHSQNQARRLNVGTHDEEL